MNGRWICSVFLLGVVVHLAMPIVPVDDVIECPENVVKKCCMNLRTDRIPNLELNNTCSYENVGIIATPSTNKSSPFRLFHDNTCLRRFPDNLCEYRNIVSIKLTWSYIKTIPSLSCLTNLIALDLRHNEIEYIANDTFTGLKKLRIINLRYNKIRTIGLGTFKEDLTSIMLVLLDVNKLQTAEAAWPMSIRHEFCHFGTSYNDIAHFTNEEGLVLDLKQNYGPGFWDLSNNNITVWILDRLWIYGIHELTDLTILMFWGFDFRENPLICDCKVHSFVKYAAKMVNTLNLQQYNVECAAPYHLKGRLLFDIDLEDFVCNVTEKCPSQCLCQNTPEKSCVYVDCSNRSLDALPDKLPDGNLTILLSGNSIRRLDPRSYLTRTVYIDIARNRLKYISPEAIQMLQSKVQFLNIENNALTHLPKIIQNIKFSKLSLGQNPLLCDCNSTWMSQWLQQQDCLNISRITCLKGGIGKVKVIDADDNFLQCQNTSISTALCIVFGILAVTFVVIVVFLLVFRYEVALLAHVFLQKLTGSTKTNFEYDIFVSVEEEAASLSWVIHSLIPELEGKRSLKLYLPARDMVPGTVIVDEMIKTLKGCRASLIVLSESYLNNPSKVYEFSEAFSIMVKHRQGQIMLVKTEDVKFSRNGYLNAYLRLKKVFDLDDHRVFDKIEHTVRINRNTYQP